MKQTRDASSKQPFRGAFKTVIHSNDPKVVSTVPPAKQESLSAAVERSNQTPMSRAAIVGIGAALVCQIVLLAIAARNNRHMIGPDGVAYMRLASYYAKGQTQLMVSGYWGPMISWLMAPLMPIFRNPMDAARVIMGLSAVVFWLGGVTVLRTLGIFPTGIVLASWFVALASVS